MESVRKVPRSFELGGCTVNPEDGSLTSPGRSVRLEPLQMDLLVFLCSRAGQVVTKDEILETVWRGRFISDDTVKSTFYQLRKALNDSPRKPRYIETIPKRGYRVLIDPVPLERPGGSGTPGTIATDLFRKGAALLSGQPSAAALKQARLYFERAIESDPDHAESGAALAHTYIHLVTSALGKGQDLLPCAKALAARASENDPKLSSARLAFGITRLLCDWEVAEAEKSFRNAIALDSGDGAPHRWLASLLSFNNMHTEAVAEARAALQADPLSLGVRRDLVETLFLARLYEEAIAEGRLLLQMSAQAADVQLGLSWIYYTVGDMDRAYDAIYAGFKAHGTSKAVLVRVERSFRRGGIRSVLQLWMQLLQSQAEVGQRSLDLLFLCSLMEERDRAFELMDRLVEQCHPSLLLLPASPLFDKLRPDPRFRRVLQQLTQNGK